MSGAAVDVICVCMVRLYCHMVGCFSLQDTYSHRKQPSVQIIQTVTLSFNVFSGHHSHIWKVLRQETYFTCDTSARHNKNLFCSLAHSTCSSYMKLCVSFLELSVSIQLFFFNVVILSWDSALMSAMSHVIRAPDCACSDVSVHAITAARMTHNTHTEH